ncbi:MAG: hypothetical protein ACYCSR_03205 [Thiomonas sp.]|uniref:Uncharacterized protein n=1 Tax=mine drainage metagenome TaxID=410659 RepID=E6PUB8_9ZZZZ
MFGPDAPASAILDMAITRAEFARQLAQAFGPLQSPPPHLPDMFAGCHDGCAWRIALHPIQPTRLGLIVLERWSVQIELDAPTPEIRARWWRRFTAYFQKGGG